MADPIPQGGVDLSLPTVLRTREFLTKVTQLQATEIVLIARDANKNIIMSTEGPEGMYSAAMLLSVATALVHASMSGQQGRPMNVPPETEAVVA